MTQPFSEKRDEIVNWAGNSTTVGKKYMPLHGRHNFDYGDDRDSTAMILRNELALGGDSHPRAENSYHREP